MNEEDLKATKIQVQVLEEILSYKDKEIERLNKENTILRQNSQYLVKQKDELEEVINKAIEYIENYLCSDEYIQSDINSIANAFVKLVDILKGVNKE